MKNILTYLDKESVNYSITLNPSDKKIKQLRDSIERRKKYSNDIQYAYNKNGMVGVKEFLGIDELSKDITEF